MKFIYQEDRIELKPERISTRHDSLHGAVTIFHDVVLASEMVQEYNDGLAWKCGDELKAYTPTVDGRWVKVGGHPLDAIISSREDINGRTVNPRFVKNLKCPTTGRPNRQGIRADIEIFDEKVPPETLKDMKNGLKSDVSIGFFFEKDDASGVIADGPFKGSSYDYIQRNMFHDHTAAGITDGRCPSPLCGIGADELKEMLANDPFAGFEDFAECLREMKKPKSEGGQGYTEEQAEKVCGTLKAKHEDTVKRETEVRNAMRIVLQAMHEAMEELNGIKDAIKEEQIDQKEWWKLLNWKEVDQELWEVLPEETKQLITDEGLCPECDEEESEEESEETGEEPEEETEETTEEGTEEESEEESEEDLPYEDGEALEFELIPVDSKPEPIKKKEKKDALDPYMVLLRADKILG